jgi:hypothetical protein
VDIPLLLDEKSRIDKSFSSALIILRKKRTMDVDSGTFPFVLREELRGHSAAVRSLCFAGNELISGGSDAVVNRWEVSASGGPTAQGAQVSCN